MRKDSIDDPDGESLNNAQILQRLEKLEARAIKMNDSIEDVINRTITAIEEEEKEINKKEGTKVGLIGLHNKMIEIKPLKSVKEEYNGFYKGLSGFGKYIEEIPKEEESISVPALFEEKDFLSIEQSISDHYLSQEQYEAAIAICPFNNKQNLFEEIYVLNKEVLEGKFDKASEWIEKIRKSHSLNEQDDQIAYEILKMKVISLVKENKGDEALAYLRNNMAVFSERNGGDISKLGNFIITQSTLFWGSERKYLGIFKDRYKTYSSIELEEVSSKLIHLYLKINQITIYNPITKCFEVGYEWRKEFLEYLKYLPKSINLPKVLPFSIKTGESLKYHSEFFCPVNKEIYKPTDKIIMLDCGHMISGAAITRIVEGRDLRRRMRCPICQSDQYLEHNKKVEF